MVSATLPGMSLATDVEVVKPRTTERDLLDLLARRHSAMLVVSDKALVKPGELPEGWGLIALDKRGSLRTVTSAPKLTPAPMPKKMLAGLLRATAKTAQREAVRCAP